MTIMRVHKTANFTVMSNFHFKEKKMSLKAKGLLSLMLSLPDTWNYSVSGLVTLSKDGKDSVMSALAELEKFGYLTRERVVNSKGQFAGVEYNIYEEPQKTIPFAAKQNEDCPTTALPTEEKPTLLNTNPIKDLENKLYNELNIKDRELLDSYIEYISIRNLSDISIVNLVKRAKRLAKGNMNLEKVMLEAAIINNWKNVYLPKEEEIKIIQEQGLEELRSFYGL